MVKWLPPPSMWATRPAPTASRLTDPTGVQVALTVSETDLPGIKVGQYGVASFDALPGSVYIVKIISVSTVPTVTQGVVTYPVQAQILRPADITADQAELTPLLPTLQSLIVANAGGATTSAAPTGGFGGAGITFGGGGAGARGNSVVLQAQPSPTPAAGTGRTRGAGAANGFRADANGTTTPATGSEVQVAPEQRVRLVQAAGGAASGEGLLRLAGVAPSPIPGCRPR